MKKYKRIILVGKAASGKTHFSEYLIKKGYNFPISYTTRPQRQDPETGNFIETDGVHYHFINTPRFLEMVADKKFYEFDEFNGWFYGRTIEDFYSGDVLIMTPSGIKQMQEKDLNESYIIYFDIDEDIRRKRLSLRNDADSVDRRILSDENDFRDFNNYTYVVNNPTFSESDLLLIINDTFNTKSNETN